MLQLSEHFSYSNISVIRTFQLSEYPPVPMHLDKWRPTVITLTDDTFITYKELWEGQVKFKFGHWLLKLISSSTIVQNITN